MQFDVTGIGSIAIDDFIFVSSYPEPDQKAPILEKRREFGGLIGTALAASAHLGSMCAYAGTIGEDELSRAINDEFLRRGIDVSHALLSDVGVPVHSIIVVDRKRHTRNIFYTTRRELSLPERDLLSLLAHTQVLLVDQSGLEAAEYARRTGVPVIADLEWTDRKDLDRFLAAVDHLILQEQVAATVTGSDHPEKALRDLHTRNPRELTLLTCGSMGCLYIAGRENTAVQRLEAFAVETEETNGCGDVFHGVYASACAGGSSVVEAVRYASAGAAVYASRKSGWRYLPGRKDIEDLLK